MQLTKQKDKNIQDVREKYISADHTIVYTIISSLIHSAADEVHSYLAAHFYALYIECKVE